MKIPLYDLQKKKGADKEMPAQFLEAFRPDLIKRAVMALESAGRQRYGVSEEAGLRHSSTTSKRRRDYRGSYGFGISRVDRKVMSRRGTRMFWVGATTPQNRGGRRAHPPKADKIQEKLINKKENRKAIRSAMAATLDRKVVEARGHKLPTEYPFIIENQFEEINKTKTVKDTLEKLGFSAELGRCAVRKVRAGLGSNRGRKYQNKRSVLIVVGAKCPLMKAAENIPGVDVVEAKAINAHCLAPGAMPGRVTLWTEKAIELIQKEKLFQ